MKELIIIEQEKVISDLNDFRNFEEKFQIKLPDFLKEFLMKYEGALIDYYTFNGKPTFKEILYLAKNQGYASIEAILNGHKEDNINGFIPFAIDSGGWDFNVSINKDTYGQVWVNKFDSGEEDTMEYVAPSFEEFINGLQEEIVD